MALLSRGLALLKEGKMKKGQQGLFLLPKTIRRGTVDANPSITE
jgi:hypothetical protein